LITPARTGPVLSSVFSEISSLGAQLLPSPALISDLTGIPATITSVIFNPSAQSSLSSQLVNNNPPAWFSALYPAAQSYILGIPAKESSVVSQIVAIEQSAGFTRLVLPESPTTAKQEISATRLLAPAAYAVSAMPETSKSHELNNNIPTASDSLSTSLLKFPFVTHSFDTNVGKSLTESTTLSIAVLPTSTTQVITSGSSKAGASREICAVSVRFLGAMGFLGLALALG